MDFTGITFKNMVEMEYNGTIYHDYRFEVSGPALLELNRYYAQMGFATVGEIMLGKEDGACAVQIIRHFDRYYETEDHPEGLYEYLKGLVK